MKKAKNNIPSRDKAILKLRDDTDVGIIWYLKLWWLVCKVPNGKVDRM